MDFKNLEVQNKKAGPYKENMNENSGLVKVFISLKIENNSNSLKESEIKFIHYKRAYLFYSDDSVCETAEVWKEANGS